MSYTVLFVKSELCQFLLSFGVLKLTEILQTLDFSVWICRVSNSLYNSSLFQKHIYRFHMLTVKPGALQGHALACKFE